MSNRSLVYRAASVEAMREALRSTRAGVSDQLSSAFSSVDGQLVGWSQTTASRQAERTAQRTLRDECTAVLDALDRLEVALGVAQEAAEEAETRNVALLA